MNKFISTLTVCPIYMRTKGAPRHTALHFMLCIHVTHMSVVCVCVRVCVCMCVVVGVLVLHSTAIKRLHMPPRVFSLVMCRSATLSCHLCVAATSNAPLTSPRAYARCNLLEVMPRTWRQSACKSVILIETIRF